jgi:DNA-binding GntR family transcriptional regulator
MNLIFDKLTKSTLTLRARIAEQIRSAMLTGALQPGERIVERKLASQFGASLAVIREAIIQLESEGFVCKKPNASTYVTKLSPKETEKILDLRGLLETFAVEEAARLASVEQIESLETLYCEMVDAAKHQEVKTYIQKDLSFHERIWQITDNEPLEEALKRIVLPLFAFSSIRVASRRSFDLLQDSDLHRSLLDAIRSKDPNAARMAYQTALDEWRSQTREFV